MQRWGANLGISKSGAGGGRKLWLSVMWPDTAFAATKLSLVFCAPVSLLLAVPVWEGAHRPRPLPGAASHRSEGQLLTSLCSAKGSYLNFSEELSFEALGSWARPVSTAAVPWSFNLSGVCGSFGTELHGMCTCSLPLSSLQQFPLRVWLYCICDFSFLFHQGFVD